MRACVSDPKSKPNAGVRRPRSYGVFFPAAAAVRVLLGNAGTANAHDSNITYGAWLGQDGGAESYCYDSAMTQEYRDQAYDAIKYLDDATVVNRDGVATCANYTDAVFVEVNIDTGWRGYTQCSDSTISYPARQCDQYWLYLNRYELGGSAQQQQKTACHELGHFMSLAHWSAPYSGCMVSGAVGSDAVYLKYTGHEILSHINAVM
jgi:hypothetical protein